MTYKSYLFEDIDILVKAAEFEKNDQVDELHIVLNAGNKYRHFDEQLEHLEQAILKLQALPRYEKFNVVFKRYFLSDAANQVEKIEDTEMSEEFVMSIVQQPPLNGSKVALWAYLMKETVKKEEAECCSVERNGYTHRWVTMHRKLGGSAAEQTQLLFDKYRKILHSKGDTLKNNCIRIWFFVQYVDLNYTAFVEARKPIFDEEGLNEKSHYLASTVIEGRSQYTSSIISADAYSVNGLEKDQVSFLHALTHLSPTIIYGVHFERGTAVTYGDRCHIFLSGTASINNKGEIVHPNQIELQMKRAIENVEALLREAGAGFDDIAQLLVYLRDTADFSLVNDYLEAQYPGIPKVIVLAPVCRPGWLIEMECIAITKCKDKRFRDF